MLNVFRITCVLGLGALLSACFTSDEPLYDVSMSSQPVAPGHYIAYEIDEDGEYDLDEPWEGDVSYVDGILHSDTENMPLEGALFRQLSGDIHAAFNATDDGDTVSYIVVFTYPDGRVFGHLPQCEGLTDEQVDLLGLIVEDHGTCKAENLATLEEALMTYVSNNHEDIRGGVVLFPAD